MLKVNQPSGVVGGGLSVVSAPAPIAQRPEIASQLNSKTAILGQTHSYDKLGFQQKTSGKPQSIRGANNIRMKQMEITGNHAVVFS